MKVLFEKCWSYSERLRADSHCLMLLPEIKQEFLQRVKIIQVADGCIDHKHHLQLQWQIHENHCQNCSKSHIISVFAAGNSAHLGDMVQEFGTGEAVLFGITVFTVVEKTGELRVQLEQSTTDK